MPIDSFGNHDCEARNQPKVDEWECSECGQIWLGSYSSVGGFLWETPENRESRLLIQQEEEERKNAPSPDELGLS